MDSETQEIFSEGEALSDYIRTKAWKQVRAKFAAKILDLQSTRNIKRASPDEMAREVDSRNAAADILYEIITEVEGDAEKFKANQSLMAEPQIVIQ